MYSLGSSLRQFIHYNKYWYEIWCTSAYFTVRTDPSLIGEEKERWKGEGVGVRKKS